MLLQVNRGTILGESSATFSSRRNFANEPAWIAAGLHRLASPGRHHVESVLVAPDVN
jgi:hypothetical protein